MKKCVFPSHLGSQLPQCFQKGQGFDIAHRTADLHQNDISFHDLFYEQYSSFDFVGDVRE